MGLAASPNLKSRADLSPNRCQDVHTLVILAQIFNIATEALTLGCEEWESSAEYISKKAIGCNC